MDQTGERQSNESLKSPYLQAIGSRILSELNDLKRTVGAAAKDLDIPICELHNIIKGKSTEAAANQLISKMGQVYPIDHLQLHLLKDDTLDGVKFMTAEESKKTSRIYDRLDKSGNLSPYYEYRDTAMSRLALFKPEWISQLRTVDNSDPDNADMILNNGHFMHQITLFVGPVNFYYEDLDGTVHCCEMNTGDCNYITPYMKHSFTNRSKDEFAYIVACTLGGEVSRAQRELYALGQSSLNKYVLDYRDTHKASVQMIKQHMDNDMLTVDNMESLLKEKGLKVDIREIFNTHRAIKIEEYESIANVLDIEIGDIMVPKYKPEEECVVKFISENKPHPFPNKKNVLYNIHTLARTSKMPLLKSSIIDVVTDTADLTHCIQKSLHTYMINFGDCPVNIKWEYEGKVLINTIDPGDSVYLKPFVKFAFGNRSNKSARMLVVGISSAISLAAQKELSTLVDPNRVINDLEPWYDY